LRRFWNAAQGRSGIPQSQNRRGAQPRQAPLRRFWNAAQGRSGVPQFQNRKDAEPRLHRAVTQRTDCSGFGELEDRHPD
jgi:hypothetical protein